jgi:hypothetical protein
MVHTTHYEPCKTRAAPARTLPHLEGKDAIPVLVRPLPF